MHDSAPCHKAEKVTKWFQERQIEVLEWPANSPDLNPLENYWQEIKKRMSGKKTPNLGTRRAELTKVWCTEMSLDSTKAIL